MRRLVLCLAAGLMVAGAMDDAAAMEMSGHHDHHNHHMDADGIVMNANTDTLPRDCDEISSDVTFEVNAGTEFAKAPNIFGMSRHEFEAPPCSRITVTFENEDEVRHQWMVHGLPRYLYPGGMFHLEVAGGKQVSGTFIVPSDHKTYLVHCDVAQHMEKGMKAQLKVGGGDGDLWSIPGVSRAWDRDDYSTPGASWMLGAGIAGSLLVVLVVSLRRRDP